MNTALSVVLMSLVALVGAAIAGGLISMGVTRIVRGLPRGGARELRPTGRESIH